MVDDADVVLAWLRDNGRLQPWRALDGSGKPRVYKRKVCEMSRNKLRLCVNLPAPRLNAALQSLMDEKKAMPVGRMLPLESSQAVELWVLL